MLSRTLLLASSAGACAIVFFEAVENVLQGEATSFDRGIALFIHRFDSPVMDALMRVLTFCGSAPGVLLVIAIVASWALRSDERRLASALVIVASAAELSNLLLKMLFQRDRPNLFFEVTAPESYSLPSGHAMASSAAYGMAAIVAARMKPKWRRPLTIATPLLVLFIGISRVFLGVHWPTDVLAGFAGGTFFVIAGVAAMSTLR